MGGLDLGTLIIGYAYDLGVSEIRTYNSGTHEIFICVKLNRETKTKTPWRKRNRVYSSYTSDN